MLIERPARQPGEEDAENSERVVVAPAFPRLEREWEIAEPGQPLIRAQGDWVRTSLRGIGRHRLL